MWFPLKSSVAPSAAPGTTAERAISDRAKPFTNQKLPVAEGAHDIDRPEESVRRRETPSATVLCGPDRCERREGLAYEPHTPAQMNGFEAADETFEGVEATGLDRKKRTEHLTCCCSSEND